jgi:hypothetical protein
MSKIVSRNRQSHPVVLAEPELQNRRVLTKEAPRCGGLTRGRRSLLELFRELSFGRLEVLVVRNGDPVLEPPPRIVRQVRFGAGDDSQVMPYVADYQLKQQVIKLFDCFDRIQNGVVDALEIQNGLPFRMTITEDHAR